MGAPAPVLPLPPTPGGVDAQELREWMQRIERMLANVAEQVSKPAEAATIMTRAEARAYVRRPSETAFARWCRKWDVRPSQHGRYSRAVLDLALNREAGVTRTPATLRRKQAKEAA